MEEKKGFSFNSEKEKLKRKFELVYNFLTKSEKKVIISYFTYTSFLTD